MTRRKRRLDQAIHDRAELLSREHPMGTVAEILGLHPSTLRVMKRRGWKAAAEGQPRRKRPSDFAIQSAHMTVGELRRHYRATYATIQRWFDETPHRRPSWKGDALRANPIRGGASQRKSKEEMAKARAKQWETRRAKYGPSGQRTGASTRLPRRET